MSGHAGSMPARPGAWARRGSCMRHGALVGAALDTCVKDMPHLRAPVQRLGTSWCIQVLRASSALVDAVLNAHGLLLAFLLQRRGRAPERGRRLILRLILLCRIRLCWQSKALNRPAVPASFPCQVTSPAEIGSRSCICHCGWLGCMSLLLSCSQIYQERRTGGLGGIARSPKQSETHHRTSYSLSRAMFITTG